MWVKVRDRVINFDYVVSFAKWDQDPAELLFSQAPAYGVRVWYEDGENENLIYTKSESVRDHGFETIVAGLANGYKLVRILGVLP